MLSAHSTSCNVVQHLLSNKATNVEQCSTVYYLLFGNFSQETSVSTKLSKPASNMPILVMYLLVSILSFCSDRNQEREEREKREREEREEREKQKERLEESGKGNGW